MKPILYSAVLIAMSMSVACTTSHASTPNFSVTTTIPPEGKNKMTYLVNRETGDKVDSLLVTDGAVKFSGTVADPYYARILVGDKRGPSFIVEPGDIVIDQDGACTSTPLNKEMKAFTDRYREIAGSLQTLPSDSLRQEAIDRFQVSADSIMNAHLSDPIGRILFLDKASECRSTAELESLLKKYPMFRENKNVADLAKSLHNAEITSPGHKFTDFSVDYNGKTQKLSDYAGKGKWLLVDFWASWCGPCRRAMPLLKELYGQYKDKGLEVLGVAVWDEPADSERAAKQMQLPWPQIIDAQKIPTDLYGIYGIPHLMLISPDGTIVARGIEGEELRKAIADSFATPAQETSIGQ
ncbi:TlpA disulfide reductase family protein [uncultured Muribaculum sp.]|uniref:TlpA disulfide reductase family protein n=1 Tax=uncultured Muribaculum sp. TaxID=1918613 RepID=UPI0025DB3909|nr:TlpA disulfide reductase family protein [uncultured Muribaculum sp.]